MFDQFTQLVVDWIQVQPILLIYVYFFLISYLENVFPPIPGDVLVAFAGYLVAESIVNFALVYLVTVIGSIIGFYHVYHWGSKWGQSIYSETEKHWVLKFLDIKYIEKGRSWMGRYGQLVIIANRFLAGTRSVIALIAGISHLSKLKTIISSTVSSLIWNAILIGFGWLIHKNWQEIGVYLANYGKIVMVLIFLFIGIKWFLGKKNTISENKIG